MTGRVHEIGQELQAGLLLQFDDCDDIRRNEVRFPSIVVHREREQCAPARKHFGYELLRVTLWADNGCGVHQQTALGAARDGEVPVMTAAPEVGLSVREYREGSLELLDDEEVSLRIVLGVGVQ
jgi:hypothetical protein